MSDCISQAYRDDKRLQDALNQTLLAEALDVPISTWFFALRSFTQPLHNPNIDDAVADALASHARLMLSSRWTNQLAADQLLLRMEAEDELCVAREEFDKRVIASEYNARSVTAAETKAKIFAESRAEAGAHGSDSEGRYRKHPRQHFILC